MQWTEACYFVGVLAVPIAFIVLLIPVATFAIKFDEVSLIVLGISKKK